MNFSPISITFFAYLVVMVAVGLVAWRYTKNFNDYILGGRRLGAVVTALSVGASDMSGWLLMGLPGAVFLSGICESWIAIGLALGTLANWLIVAAPSPAWARKVFPGEPEDIAVEKLWNAIFDCLYLKEGEDVEKIWQAHCDRMTQKANWLNEQAFRKLHYTSKNGTDFTVELIPDAKWSGAGDINHMNNTFYVPNMPTEEVFTSPMRGKCEGRLVSTKPLSWSGQVINNFTVDFKDGKVVDCHAEQGEEVLKKMFAMDEGAAMLGEVALVPKESPINQSGLMFFNTLFDENACCHVAAGAGFSEVLDGFMDMSDEEILAKGINDSLIHVDFMVGSDDLHIVGIHEDGSETDVFVNGTWAE